MTSQRNLHQATSFYHSAKKKADVPIFNYFETFFWWLLVAGRVVVDQNDRKANRYYYGLTGFKISLD